MFSEETDPVWGAQTLLWNWKEKQQLSREAQVGGICSDGTECDIFSSAEGAFTCLQLICKQGVSQEQLYKHNQGNRKLQGGKGVKPGQNLVQTGLAIKEINCKLNWILIIA